MKFLKHWKKVVFSGLLVAALAVGATAAFAQGPSDNESNGPGFGRGFGRHGHHGFGGPRGGGDRGEFLAEELGITVEELEAARQTAREKALQQALDDGRITQEQFDLIKAKEALKDYIDREAIMAEALGMSAEELEAALADGTRMRDLLDELGLDSATVREAMQEAHAAAIQQAVEDNVITQEQADQLQDGPGKGGFGGRRGGRGFGGQRGPQNQGSQGFGPGAGSL